MNKTIIAALLLIPSLASLQGCQRESAQQQATPSAAATTPPAATVPQPVQPAAMKAVAAGTGSSSDQGARALAQKSGCFACHMIDKKSVGPSWKEVAAKYRGQKGAEAKLVEKVAKGGSGVWGSAPMPPNSPKVSQGDIKTLVRFILGLK